jgi:hypothetical protein
MEKVESNYIENGLFKYNQLVSKMENGVQLTSDEMLFITSYNSKRMVKIGNIFLWVYIILPVIAGVLLLGLSL